MATKTRTRRTPEELIKDLEAKIAEVKARAARKKVQKDPALRHISAAIRSLDKGAKASEDNATRKALGEARATLAACLSLNAGTKAVLIPKPRKELKPVAEKDVLKYLKANPKSGGEQVAEALGVDTASLRPVMKQLIADGKARKAGKGRGTVYAAK